MKKPEPIAIFTRAGMAEFDRMMQERDDEIVRSRLRSASVEPSQAEMNARVEAMDRARLAHDAEAWRSTAELRNEHPCAIPGRALAYDLARDRYLVDSSQPSTSWREVMSRPVSLPVEEWISPDVLRGVDPISKAVYRIIDRIPPDSPNSPESLAALMKLASGE